jgi:CheY-like chemotaxis protein
MEPVPTALVVDDDSEWLRILSDELLRAGFKIDWASSREGALRKIAEPLFAYDVVFLDPNLDESLGGISGLAVAERLAARNPGADVVLVSGYASPAELSAQFSIADVKVLSIFAKDSFEVSAFQELVLDLRGVDQASEALFRCDRESLLASWQRVKAATTKSDKGELLEDFVVEMLSGIPLLELAERRMRTQTSEIDAVFRVHAAPGTLCQEWGGHVLVECRNREEKFDAAAVKVFGQTLRDSDAKIGIVVSMAGVTGNIGRDAEGEIGNIFRRDHCAIIVLDEVDLLAVLHGQNLYEMLRERDTAVRFTK